MEGARWNWLGRRDDERRKRRCRKEARLSASRPSESAIDVERRDNWSISNLSRVVWAVTATLTIDKRAVSAGPVDGRQSSGGREEDGDLADLECDAVERNFQRADGATARWMDGGDGRTRRLREHQREKKGNEGIALVTIASPEKLLHRAENVVFSRLQLYLLLVVTRRRYWKRALVVFVK